MHLFLGLSSLLLVLLGGYGALAILRRLDGWSRRRDLQFVVLAAPVVSLGLGIAGVLHFAGRTCFLGAPPWDYRLSAALPLAMGGVALGGIGLGFVRLALMARVVASRGLPSSRELQAVADRLAQRLGAPRPRVLVCACDRPLALTSGLFRPTLLLSTWMVEHLDRHELESVLAHELGHVARRDYLVIWLATLLRDAFFYLPTSWAAYRQLQHEKELACDDLAVSATSRPLALASALTKVWQQAVGGPALGVAAPLTGMGEAIEGRVERLLAAPNPQLSRPRPRVFALGVGGSALSGLVGLLVLKAPAVVLALTAMGCGPASSFGKLG